MSEDRWEPVDASLDEIITIASGLKSSASGNPADVQAGLAGLQAQVAALTATEIPGITVIPAEDVKPEDVGTLSLRYVDGVAQLVVSGGTHVPAGLTVVDSFGAPVANYTATVAPADAASRNITEANGLVAVALDVSGTSGIIEN